MTKRRDFKALVRERMDKTGERYTAARAQLLGRLSASRPASVFPGLLPGYDTFGCADRMQELQTIASDCKLTKIAATAFYVDIAGVVGQIAEAERAAVELMNAALKGNWGWERAAPDCPFPSSTRAEAPTGFPVGACGRIQTVRPLSRKKR